MRPPDGLVNIGLCVHSASDVVQNLVAGEVDTLFAGLLGEHSVLRISTCVQKLPVAG